MATNAVTKPISLKNGNDKIVADQLKAMHSELSGFATKSFLFGIYGHYIKEVELKKNQFGEWLQQHAPELCRLDTKTQKPKATSSFSRHLDFSKEVIGAFGLSLTSALQKIKTLTKGSFPTVGNVGHLLIEDKESAVKVIPKHEELVSLLANNSRRQVVHTLVQMEEDDNGIERRKRGRLKGQGGASREQRAAAKEAEERAEVEAMELDAQDFDKWIDKVSDAKGLPRVSQKVWDAHLARVRFHYKWMESVHDARKGTSK